jgi:hypothetical protein
MSATAAAFVGVPAGGMFPPYHVRHEVLGFTSAGGELMYPCVSRYVYAWLAVDMLPWHVGQLPIVPVARYFVKIVVHVGPVGPPSGSAVQLAAEQPLAHGVSVGA